MSNLHTLAFEIGTEEIPAYDLHRATAQARFPLPQPPQWPPSRIGHRPQFSPQRESSWFFRLKGSIIIYTARLAQPFLVCR